MAVVGKYELGKVLGAGDFDCRIRICTHTITGANYAVKIYDKKILEECAWMWERIREAVQVMRTMPKHEHIIEMVECFETKSSLYILMQLYSPIHVTQIYTTATKRIPMQRTKLLFTQLVKGILHMHDHGVVHLGIAPDHLLVNEKDLLKVGFLVSCKYQTKGRLMMDMRGTTATVAPEILCGEPYDPYLADVWSVGVVLYFMLNGGRYPFDGANTTKNILERRIRPQNPNIPAAGRQLVETLLQPVAQKRLPLRDILNHSWFQTEDVEEDSGSDLESVASSLARSMVEAEEDDDIFKITIPYGLSREEEAALIIQHTWRMYKKRVAQEESLALRLSQQAPQRQPSFSRNLSRIQSSFRLSGKSSMRGSREDIVERSVAPAVSAIREARARPIDNNPHRCQECGRLPPPRVIPGRKPYPDVEKKMNFRIQKGGAAVYTPVEPVEEERRPSIKSPVRRRPSGQGGLSSKSLGALQEQLRKERSGAPLSFRQQRLPSTGSGTYNAPMAFQQTHSFADAGAAEDRRKSQPIVMVKSPDPTTPKKPKSPPPAIQRPSGFA